MSQADTSDINAIEQEMPSVNERERKGGRLGRGILILFLLLVLVMGLGGAYVWTVKQSKSEPDTVVTEEPKASLGKLFDGSPPKPEATVENSDTSDQLPPPPGVAVPAVDANAQVSTPPPKPQLDRSASGLMVVETEAIGAAAANPAAAQGEASDMNDGGGSGQPTGLAALFVGTKTDASRAGHLGDRNMTVAKGAMIDCTLKTRLDTTVPGMSSCVVTRNIYSDNGHVLLIERGSEVTGEYSRGVQQGQNRIFVLWNRLKTPNGIVVDLNSPGTDTLGAAGLGGQVKYHFWRRFGAALLVSVIEDAADYASTRSNNGGTTVNTGNTSDTASDLANTILEQTINIAPTLYKNQGDRVSIFVARDLYFGDVYGLRSN